MAEGSSTPPASSFMLILIARTALEAPASSANPTAVTMIPGMNSAWLPSIRMPTRLITYAGAAATPLSVPVTAALTSLSRRVMRFVSAFSRRVGTDTYASIIRPTLIPMKSVNQWRPWRAEKTADHPTSRPITAPEATTIRQLRRALRRPSGSEGPSGFMIAKAVTAFR